MSFDNNYFYGIDSIDIEKNKKDKQHIFGIYDKYNFDKALNNLEKILKNNEILSKRLLKEEINKETYTWEGLDHISLLDYDIERIKKIQSKPSFTDYSFYSLYIECQLSLMLKKEGLKVIKPKLYKGIPIFNDIKEEMKQLMMNEKERYTDVYDEVQVRDKISLDRLEGLTIPTEYILFNDYENYTKEELTKHLKKVNELLKSYKKDIPIYDILTRINITNDDSLDKIIKNIEKSKRKIKK